MNKLLLLFITFCCISSSGFSQETGAKLSPETRLFLHDYAINKGNIRDYITAENSGITYLTGMIKVNNAVANEQIKALGIIVGTRAGNIWTVQIPADNAAAFTRLKGIDYIDLDEPVVRPMLDSARKATHVDSVHAGIGLPFPVHGENVVVGIVDGGFDYTHPTMFDSTGTRFRIKRVWEEATPGTPPAGYTYGNLMTDSNAMWAKGWDYPPAAPPSDSVFPEATHGTHVTGIAAGSGFGSDATNTKFRGMAYGSDIVLVGVTYGYNQAVVNTSLSKYVDGVNFIYTYAASVNKPAVVNISSGSMIGPHDGTSLYSQAIDNLTGPGKILALSAGNSGYDPIHLLKAFTATDTVVNTTVQAVGPGLFNFVDIWGDTAKTFCLKVSMFANGVVGNTLGYICLDNQVHDTFLIDNNHDTLRIKLVTNTSEFNDKSRIYLQLHSNYVGTVALSVKANSGKINAWAYDVTGFMANGTGTVAGNTATTISEQASTKSVIAVAAYSTKANYVNVSNVTEPTYGTKNALAYFSSRGPDVNNIIRPDIAAPGFAVGSSVSSYDTSFGIGHSQYSAVVTTYHKPQNGRDYNYAMFSGTSMASPCTAGIVALMLQLNPTLTPAQVKAILYATAIHDTYTGVNTATGNNNWGHGKINAYGAVQQVAKTASVHSIAGNPLNCIVYPNPAHASFNIVYAGDRSETVAIAVYDINGKLVMSDNEWKVNAGSNEKQLNVTDLKAGLYFTHVTGARGYAVIKTVVE